MYRHENKKIFPLNGCGKPAHAFVVEPDEEYKIIISGYIDKNNPSGDAVADPGDIKKIEIIEVGKLVDGTKVLKGIVNCNCGVRIEVYKKTL